MSEYDDMKVREALENAEKRRVADAAKAGGLVSGTKMLIEREWRALGFEPIHNADGSLTAPSTLKTVGRWPPVVPKKKDIEEEVPF